MIEFLLALCLNMIFWGGYFLGWKDCKEQEETNRNIDKLYELAKRGLDNERNSNDSKLENL